MADDASAVGELRGPGGDLGWEATVASVEDLAAASRAEAVARVGVRARELVEERPRTRGGSLSPSWAI